MSWPNFHTHSNFCDGQDTLENFVAEAIGINMESIGFSGHAPMPCQTDWNMKEADLVNYFGTIDGLKSKFGDRIRIYKGLEVDFLPGLQSPSSFEKYSPDYVIGSIHLLGQFDDGEPFGVDYSPENFEKGLGLLFNSNVEKMVESYCMNIIQMVENDPPDIIGHLDIIKKFNKGAKYFDENEKWYQDILKMAVRAISKTNCIVEVNTRGVYKGLTEHMYPSVFILKECLDAGIPLALNADAHHPSELNLCFGMAIDMLLGVGYKEIYVLEDKKWMPKPLPKAN